MVILFRPCVVEISQLSCGFWYNYNLLNLLFLNAVWFSLVEIIVICSLTIYEAGVSAVPGVIFVFLLQPLPGVTSIRAYGQEAQVHDEFSRFIDANHRAYILFVHLSQWFALRLDFAATICITMTALLVVLLRHSIAPGLAGVVLVQSLQLTGLYTRRSSTFYTSGNHLR
ncbi:hypothetical protein L7F22_055162 [Adiantum nelumboides]|nr:hypothetical protein [Adiantum nelumboides]